MQLITKLYNLYFSPFKGISRLSWSVLLAIFINSMGQMFLLFIALYLNSIGLHIELIGFVIACYHAGGLIGGYFGGSLSEKLGIKVLFFSLISSSILLLVLAVIDTISFKIIAIFLLGVSHNFFKPASIYFLLLLEQDNRTRLLGLRRVLLNLGASAGAVIGGILSIKGYIYVFLGESLFSMMAFLIVSSVYFYNKDSLLQDKQVVGNAPSKDYSNLGEVSVLYLLFFVNMMVFAQLFITYPLYLKEYLGFSSEDFSRLFIINGILIVLFEIPLLGMIKGANQVNILIYGSILLCNGLAMLNISHNVYLVYFSTVIWTLGEILFFSAILNLILSVSTKDHGIKIGLYQVVQSMALLVSPIVGGVLYSYSSKLLWWSCTLVSIFSYMVLMMKYRSFSGKYKTQ